LVIPKLPPVATYFGTMAIRRIPAVVKVRDRVREEL
jgi:hypothetical protein